MSLDRIGYTTSMDKMFPIKKNTMWVWEEEDILKGTQNISYFRHTECAFE